MKTKAIILILLISCTVNIHGQTVAGIVFEDKNGNGIKDKHEKALKGIPVSNGDTIVLSDKKGTFALQTTESHGVFPILPADKTISCDKVTMTRAITFSGTEEYLTIPLTKQVVPRSFRMAAVGDVQINDLKELDYASRSVMSELAERKDLSFIIFMGDLVNDNTLLLERFSEMAGILPHPSWTLVGNHDRDTDSIRLTTAYNKVFGTEDYAFNYGNTHFIILNNVKLVNAKGYTGALSERQLRFIRNSLAFVPKDKTIVICQHIPMIRTEGKERLSELLADRPKVLIMSGHTHIVSKHIITGNICEQGVGAACGSWWTGNIGIDGIPLALQKCGSPRNYFTVDFDSEGYGLKFKGISLNEQQADVWISGEQALDNQIPDLADVPPCMIVANIFGGTDSTTTLVKIDDGEWYEMEHTEMVAPSISRLIEWNKNGNYPSKYNHLTPYRKTNSPHIWKLQLPEKAVSGNHTITIRAYDDYGFCMEYKRMAVFSSGEVSVNKTDEY